MISETMHKVQSVKFDGDYMLLAVDNQTIKLKLSQVSEKLANASEAERSQYSISPSGYGIHWHGLDEDLSINGLLKSQSR